MTSPTIDELEQLRDRLRERAQEAAQARARLAQFEQALQQARYDTRRRAGAS